MKLQYRRRRPVRWPLIGAAAFAAAALATVWVLFLRNTDEVPSDEELREIEAFEEYERRKGGA